MSDLPREAELQSTIATMRAWREVRDLCKPGSKEYQEYDKLYKEAEAQCAMSDEPRRLAVPWSVEETSSGFTIVTANGVHICSVYAEEAKGGASKWENLSPAEGQRVARAIARMPEMLDKEAGAS
jgi:hypothetical protein